MLRTLTQNWWLVVLRGVLAVLFGVVAFIWPGPTLEALVLIFGAYALVDGVFLVATGIIGTNASGGTRWFLVLGGILGIIVGIGTFFYPGITATSLLYVIGAWAIITGVFEAVAAFQLRQEIDNEWLYIISGVLSIAFGVLVFVYPQASALSIIWLIAIYAVVYGIAIIALGFRVRSLGTTISNISSGTV
jgi:uncharacterized membrane protein HdeD (DUF308 family)